MKDLLSLQIFALCLQFILIQFVNKEQKCEDSGGLSYLLCILGVVLNLQIARISKGWFTIYVYKARWVPGQKTGKIVNVSVPNCKRGGGWVVKNGQKIVKLNCERPLMDEMVPNRG